jgi:endonuclease/exonuclease/phosphatase family metal-dependent hydrolase
MLAADLLHRAVAAQAGQDDRDLLLRRPAPVLLPLLAQPRSPFGRAAHPEPAAGQSLRRYTPPGLPGPPTQLPVNAGRGDWQQRRRLLSEQLPPLDVDVCLLQEVVCGAGRGDQLEELAEMLGFDWRARVVAESRPHEIEEEGVAIIARAPLRDVAVWPLPPSHPPRHLLEASVDFGDARLRLATLHAAVSPDRERDEQISTLARLTSTPLLIGADLNAPPAIVRPLLGETFIDALDWNASPTWPVDETEFVRAWEEKLGEPPAGEVEPRRLDYLLARDVHVERSGTLALGTNERTASDHKLVWADLSNAHRDASEFRSST